MEKQDTTSRRSFVKQAAIIGAGALTLPTTLSSFTSAANESTGDNYTFLFQGDSITDGNRTRDTDWNHILGHGYAYLIAGRLWYQFPEKKFHFFNRGVSGNSVPDMAARWDSDTLAIKPDLLSILIGVNDTFHAVGGDKNFTVESYENGYRALLTQARQQSPQMELVLMEPFILPGTKTKDKWEDFQREITGRQAVVKKLAEEFSAIFVPLQESFTKAAEKYPPNDYWLFDGVHPMPNGHEMMARAWIKHVGRKLRFIR
jgi:lysophospholipase L1-like esterase